MVKFAMIVVLEITAVFANAADRAPDQVRGRFCIVHLLRHAFDFVSWKDRKPVVAALRPFDHTRHSHARTLSHRVPASTKRIASKGGSIGYGLVIATGVQPSGQFESEHS